MNRCPREAAATTAEGAPAISSGRSRPALASYSRRISPGVAPGSTPRMWYQVMSAMP